MEESLGILDFSRFNEDGVKDFRGLAVVDVTIAVLVNLGPGASGLLSGVTQLFGTSEVGSFGDLSMFGEGLSGFFCLVFCHNFVSNS